MARSDRRHLVTLQGPTGTAVPDNEGGYAQLYADLSPATAWAAIRPATARDLERVSSGTTIATASHIVEIDYHPQVTTQTRVIFGSRTLNVTGVSNPEERNIELILVCVEIEGAPAPVESWIEVGAWMEA
jgi:SPP1 family predicted phage head-tail adaptor